MTYSKPPFAFRIPKDEKVFVHGDGRDVQSHYECAAKVLEDICDGIGAVAKEKPKGSGLWRVTFKSQAMETNFKLIAQDLEKFLPGKKWPP